MRKFFMVAGLAVAGASGFAEARPLYIFDFEIDAAQEVPPPPISVGFGTGLVSYDSDTNMLSWSIHYAGLIGTPTLAHFHGDAPPGVNAAALVDIAALSGGLADPMVGSTTIPEAFEPGLLAELWYVNIHTTFAPGGEIRGQVTLVPTPGALSLVGLGGLSWLRRRR